VKGITEGSGCAGEVSVSDLVQYYFCPRKVYFLRVAELQVPPRSKMRLGTEEHEREHRRIKERRNVYGLAANDVRCVSHNVFTEADCGLYGQIDTLVTLTNGNVVPVEVKYSDRVTIFRQWKKQMTAYAFLLRSLGHRVTYGVIYFPRQKTTVNIPVYSDDLDHILKDVAKVKSLLEGEKMPRGVREEKCTYCEVRKFCVK
jgi:CRISPR-associated exonuclease Cas4